MDDAHSWDEMVANVYDYHVKTDTVPVVQIHSYREYINELDVERHITSGVGAVAKYVNVH